MKRFLNHWGVTFAALTSLAGPDAVSIFLRAGPVLDAVLRLGQIGVAAVTILYIYKRWRAKPRKRTKKTVTVTTDNNA